MRRASLSSLLLPLSLSLTTTRKQHTAISLFFRHTHLAARDHMRAAVERANEGGGAGRTRTARNARKIWENKFEFISAPHTKTQLAEIFPPLSLFLPSPHPSVSPATAFAETPTV